MRGPSGRASWKIIHHQEEEEKGVTEASGEGSVTGERGDSSGPSDAAVGVREEDVAVECVAAGEKKEGEGEVVGMADTGGRSAGGEGREGGDAGHGSGGQEASEDDAAQRQSPASGEPPTEALNAGDHHGDDGQDAGTEGRHEHEVDDVGGVEETPVQH